MYRPIEPIRPNMNIPTNLNSWEIINGAIILITAVLAAFLIAKYAEKRWQGDSRKLTIAYIGIVSVMSVLLFYFFGLSAITLKGQILCLILLISSYSDIKTRECDDWLHVMIVIAGLIGTNINLIPKMIISSLAVGGVMLIPIIFADSNLGGADIKCAAVCTFMLGLEKGIIGLTIGLILGIIFNIFVFKNRKDGFPLIPYLTAGYLTAYFI